VASAEARGRSGRRPAKLLVACSSLDLLAPLSATPAWWQLLKALYETGIELAVTTYHGRAPETLWWHAYPNPLVRLGRLYAVLRSSGRRLGRGRVTDAPADGRETLAEAVTRRMARGVAAPWWRRHLARILRSEGNIDAVVLVSIPPNHLRGVAASIARDFRVPTFLYDGDAPASLPSYRGFSTGFRIYQGANLEEFAATISNSKGSEAALREMGARAVHTLYYGADPEVYAPLAIPPDVDVFFYGHTAEYRTDWLRAMVGAPSEALAGARFAVRGPGLGDVGRAQTLPYLSFDRLREYVARSRICLLINRQAHACVYGSSTMRPFELGMMGACMVSNPYLGIEEWFEPGQEVVLVGSAEEAVDRYRFLLGHDADRRAIGEAARRRTLAQHTFRHRAAQLVDIVGTSL
jgi:glycosyltransferase involved in cell wall biosynthesis